VIPYRSIQMIRELIAGEAEFSWQSSGRLDANAASDIEPSTDNGTR
jgi:hypothetical protein